MEGLEAPETVVLTMQKAIYTFVDERKALENTVNLAEKNFLDAKSRLAYNETCIRETAEFLQQQCPDAVKGTWLEEVGFQ